MNMKSIYHILNKCYQKTILTNKDRAKTDDYLKKPSKFSDRYSN